MTNYELYQGDCLDIMPTLAAGSIDLTVTSPPYDNLRDYGKDFDADTFDWHSIIRELYRVTAVGGVVVWVVADATIKGSETGTSFRQALWAMECGFNQETMIYHVPGVGAKGSHNFYWQAHEFMFVWVKGVPKTFNPIKDKINKYAGSFVSRGEKTKATGTRKGSYVVRSHSIRQNVWSMQSGNGHQGDEVNHPATFPEKLANDHTISWSNPGDVIFDPMMGSGTTGKMAIRNGRNFIGIELDESYFNIARTRIKNAAGDYVTTPKEKASGQIALWDIV